MMRSTRTLSVCHAALRRAGLWVVTAAMFVIAGAESPASAQEVVLYASDAFATRGNWAQVASASGANHMAVQSTDWGG